MDSTQKPRREIWLRVSPKYDVSILIVSNENGQVVMSELAAATIVGTAKPGMSDDAYYVTYPVVTELLELNGYRYWGEAPE